MRDDDIKRVNQRARQIWTIDFRGGDGEPASVEIIASSYEVVNQWIMRYTWCNTVTHVGLTKTITEIGG